jgi:hypothetical protein
MNPRMARLASDSSVSRPFSMHTFLILFTVKSVGATDCGTSQKLNWRQIP